MEGTVIKGVPGNSYLQELREIFYKNTVRRHYENSGTVKCFFDNMDVADSHDIKYDVILDTKIITDLVSMTPLSWGITDGSIQKLLEMNLLKLELRSAMVRLLPPIQR